ncbi:MAG: phage baseplate assembly protein V [Myxococcota bacterium]
MTSPVETLLAPRYAERSDPTIHGVLTARVTGRMPDGTYELEYLSMGRNAPSAPARVMGPMAGNGRGLYAMPEVGDEVVVAFDGGDPNMPIILGGVWNGESTVPDQAEPSDDNHVRTWVSRSGHAITFDDEGGGEQVRVKSQGGREIVLDDTLPGKVTIKSPTGAEIELDDATQTLTLRSPLAIKLETGVLAVAAGSFSMAPPAPGSAIPAPPGPTVIQSPLHIQIEALSIRLKAALIELETTGSAATSMVVIDGKPFGAHTHGVPAATGPVTP